MGSSVAEENPRLFWIFGSFNFLPNEPNFSLRFEAEVGTPARPRRLRIMSAWKSADDRLEWSVVDETIDHRLAEVTAWLRENKLSAGNPEEMGSVERAYWHFGY